MESMNQNIPNRQVNPTGEKGSYRPLDKSLRNCERHVETPKTRRNLDCKSYETCRESN
ncbi:hypothetical protein DPMN_026596 [Dreissena polymorpha]|uniref:Uncharacterized protein n=1 Tax=Dreissena polymorpha TaxID=45954 RepID=A0A9D4RDN1_DREPO|nr:hypothetical protein DPMN_026596 [Dreissena polymorpha]